MKKMCCWGTLTDDADNEEETKPLVAKDVVCFTCNSSCRTTHLYTTMDGIKGMCNQCFFDFDHFDLLSV